MVNTITCSINCEYSIAATLCTVVYMACFRYINVNTVRKVLTNNNSNNNNNNNTVSAVLSSVL